MLLTAAFITATLVGCSAVLADPPASSGPGLPTSSPTASADVTESLAPFICAMPISGAATTPRAQISDIRVGEHAGFDRIVFEFAAGTPQYTIERAQPPLERDPSGLPATVGGSSFLRIVLHGGTVQLPNGGTSYAGPTSYSPGFTRLKDLQSAGDFEAVGSWYVGMSGDACVRAFTLTAPSRLVIDLQH
jgi:hypothetical protein